MALPRSPTTAVLVWGVGTAEIGIANGIVTMVGIGIGIVIAIGLDLEVGIGIGIGVGIGIGIGIEAETETEGEIHTKIKRFPVM